MRGVPIVCLLCLVLLMFGCQQRFDKHLAPPSGELISVLRDKGVAVDAPILIRIFKKTSEFEVWKQGDDGRYLLVMTYPICHWAGVLGPKRAEGDHQSPEGFYMVNESQMNPWSRYYLSFDLGFPNVLDENLNRYGSYLMVHGDCISVGCYAMTDSVMSDIYALARESFAGGQEFFQVHAFPFRMTGENLREYSEHPEYDFWLNLKEGYDFFEIFRVPPRVSVCGARYVFDHFPDGTENLRDSFYPCPYESGIDEG